MIKRFIEDDAGWIAYLNHQIDKELDKDPGEQNWDRIEEYQKALDEVCKGTYDPDPDIKEEKLNELRRLYHKTGKTRGLRTEHPHWIPGAVAACLLIVILGIPVMSAAINRISPIDVIRRWGEQFFNIPYNVPVEKDGITFVRHEAAIRYGSIEELLNSEKLNILYPSILPEGVSVNKVYYSVAESGDSISITFIPNTIEIVIVMSEEYNKVMVDESRTELNIVGEKTNVLVLNKDEYVEMLFVYKGVSYSIKATDESTLGSIVAGLIEWRVQ